MNKKEFENIHVLILEGYSRQCLPFMRGFKKMGCRVSLLCNSRIDCGYLSVIPDKRILGICDRGNYKKSEEYIVNLIKNGDFDIVFPMGDFGAKILSNNKTELSKYAKIASNDLIPFQAAYDKLNVMKICMENGIPCPYTQIGKSDKSELEFSKDKFPMVIKPRSECGGRGFYIFSSYDELSKYIDENNIDVSDYVFQEYIPKGSYLLSEQVFVDDSGVIKSSFQYKSERVYPLKGGTGTLNKLVDIQQMHESTEKLIKLLDLKGCIGIDFMLDSRDNVAKVIEINPRTLACSRIGFEAGIDISKQVLQKELGLEVTQYNARKREIRIRMSQVDFLWFIKSKDRFKCTPSWFSVKNTYDQMFYFSDPLPWFSFLVEGLITFFKEKR